MMSRSLLRMFACARRSRRGAWSSRRERGCCGTRVRGRSIDRSRRRGLRRRGCRSPIWRSMQPRGAWRSAATSARMGLWRGLGMADASMILAHLASVDRWGVGVGAGRAMRDHASAAPMKRLIAVAHPHDLAFFTSVLDGADVALTTDRINPALSPELRKLGVPTVTARFDLARAREYSRVF